MTSITPFFVASVRPTRHITVVVVVIVAVVVVVVVERDASVVRAAQQRGRARGGRDATRATHTPFSAGQRELRTIEMSIARHIQEPAVRDDDIELAHDTSDVVGVSSCWTQQGFGLVPRYGLKPSRPSGL